MSKTLNRELHLVKYLIKIIKVYDFGFYFYKLSEGLYNKYHFVSLSTIPCAS